MKQITLALLMICPFLLMGQTSGEITYKETIKIEVELPEGMEQFKDMIPTSRDFNKVLAFNEKVSMYQDQPADKAEEETNTTEGGIQMRMEFARPDNKLYSDMSSGKTLEARSFMDKKFLIEGKIKRYKWQLVDEQKEILGYPCQKAIYKDTSNTVIAWFTSKIPVSIGPSAYSGLPGMIMEMDIDDGRLKVVAINVDLKTIDQKSMIKPKKGKKVSEEDFNKIVAEKTKEQQEEFGGSGNVIIQTRRN